LTRRYDKRADVVLAEYLQPLPREKGEQRAFRVIAPLPNRESFIRMQAAIFRTSLAVQVDEAYNELRALADSMDEWYNSLPAGFRVAEHGKQIEACRDEMQAIVGNKPNVPKGVSDVRVLFVPPENPDGR